MASKIGLFISTFLKVSNISFSCSSFFINLQRKGRGVLEAVETLNVTFGANFSFVDPAFSRAEFSPLARPLSQVLFMDIPQIVLHFPRLLH